MEQMTITKEQLVVLLWVKALDEYVEGNYSLGRKIEMFDLEQEDNGYDVFTEGIAFWGDYGVLQWNQDDLEWELTETGKRLLKALDTVSGLSDDKILSLYNGTVSTITFIKENKSLFSCMVKIIGKICGIVGELI